jgi:hypothetical protein
MSGGFEEGSLHPFTGGGDSGYRAARRSAVNNDVEGLGGVGDGGEREEEKRKTAGLRHQFRLDQMFQPSASPANIRKEIAKSVEVLPS